MRRIWCCLPCFGEFDKEVNNAMDGDKKDESADNHADDCEGNRGNEDDVEKISSQCLELGFGVMNCNNKNNSSSSTSIKVGNSKRDLTGEVVDRDKSVPELLELSIGESSSRIPPRPDDASRAAGDGETTVFEEEVVYDSDFHHKRAKLDSSLKECRFTTSGLLPVDNRYDVISSYNSSDDSSVYQRNKTWQPSSSLEGDVNTSCHTNEDNTTQEDFNTSNMDGMEIQMDLSDDLLHLVFSFLGHGDLCGAAMVCKQWRVASTREEFWRSLNFENRYISVEQLEDIWHRYPTLSSLTVSNCPALHRISITSNALKKLALHKQESLNSLSLQCLYLEEVDLADCGALTDSVCNVFSDGGGCPMLKSLILDNCENLTTVELHSTTLTSLSLAGCRAIKSLNLTCPYVEQVRLDGCDHLERASFIPIGLLSLNLGICPKLNVLYIEAPRMVGLELKGCGVLSEVSIDCPLLTSLDASFCSQLEDKCLSATATSCPLIEKLILMSCPSIGAEGLSALCLLKTLTYLDLSYTFLMDLEAVFQSCSRLTVLKLQACKYLNDSSLEALYKEGALPALHELDLSYGTLCQSSIEELLAYCTHLTHISLNGCIHMHDLNWGLMSPSSYQAPDVAFDEIVDVPTELPHRLLQNLNCVGCPNIKRVFIPSTAQCMSLLSLNLSLSANLKEVYISCSNLCFLNLSNCSSLESLRLECPKLTSLFLQSCNIDEETVESAISTCSMLETLNVRFCPKIASARMTKLRVVHPNLKRIFCSRPPC